MANLTLKLNAQMLEDQRLKQQKTFSGAGTSKQWKINAQTLEDQRLKRQKTSSSAGGQTQPSSSTGTAAAKPTVATSPTQPSAESQPTQAPAAAVTPVQPSAAPGAQESVTQRETAPKEVTAPSAAQAETVRESDGVAENVTRYAYDPAADAAYQQALAALRQAQAQVPTYAGTYDDRLNELYEQIVNRKEFQYDVSEDALYRQYAEQYARAGELAMRDTMGQAAVLTGGYGNSYVATAGNQAYRSYLQQLNEVVPELYGMAQDRYNAEGERLLEQYSMTGELADAEYEKYLNELALYRQTVDDLKEQTDDAYDRGRDNWYTAYQMGVDADNAAYERQIYEDETAHERETYADEIAYGRQQDAYDRLVSLITSTGYTPNVEELSAAGMSEREAQAYGDYYSEQRALSAEDDAVLLSEGGFTGTNRSEAIAYMEAHGVPSQIAGMLLKEELWQQEKAKGNSSYEVAGYDTYAEYLADAVAIVIENYGM